jgi:hypothetical protein
MSVTENSLAAYAVGATGEIEIIAPPDERASDREDSTTSGRPVTEEEY